MKFATWVYRIAGVYGLLVIAPLFFLERVIAQNDPPAITHPEYYYGFAVVTVAWQLAFLVIAHNPQRFRPLMPVTWIEKLYGFFAIALYAQGRISTQALALGLIDLLLGVLFVCAFWTSRPRAQ
jgi:hypothetical protein